jgi:YbbR domain-containing protein
MMRLITEHLGWKLFSLAASIGLWYAFIGEAEVASSIPAVVRYLNVPSELEITSEAPERLFLKLRGPATRLAASELAQITLALDLRNVHGSGEQTFTITEQTLGLPPGVDLVRAVPAQVRLRFDTRASKQVPVELRYAGPPAKGYRVAGQVIVPESVRIIGPEARLARIDNVQTDPVDLSAAVGNAEFRVPVALEDPYIRFDGQPPVIAVRITLEKIP